MVRVSVMVMCALLVCQHLSGVSGQFSFSIPGKWGNGKRSGSSALQRPSRDCDPLNYEVLYDVYKLIKVGDVISVYVVFCVDVEYINWAISRLL